MLAAVGGLAYTLAALLRVQSYLGYLLPLPIVVAAMRGGGAAGRRTMSATAFLLLGVPCTQPDHCPHPCPVTHQSIAVPLTRQSTACRASTLRCGGHSEPEAECPWPLCCGGHAEAEAESPLPSMSHTGRSQTAQGCMCFKDLALFMPCNLPASPSKQACLSSCERRCLSVLHAASLCRGARASECPAVPQHCCQIAIQPDIVHGS